MPMARLLVALSATSFVVLAHGGRASAEPQATAAVTIGMAGRGNERRVWDNTAFHLGLRGDVLFFRQDAHDFGFGPYAEALTHAFDEFQLGGGAALLVPVLETMPLVFSGGAYGRVAENGNGFEPGLAASIFWGSRSYNFHSSYGMAGGLLAQFRAGLGSSRETSIVVGAQLDLAILTMPVVLLINALRPSPEVAPVK
ncbi:hypothetical protein [Chondromyces crocatus]|uniref:Secreted protein n=1 Tax=Chondromyces crocatus TaxID=52 RepID=A0A0K1E6B6_CHOCO|nr:hypothetical protein [Chondromyces crocatus]AKT36420.1 uncharacterized protein CMC5_005330 [Chondromyces crocatus]